MKYVLIVAGLLMMVIPSNKAIGQSEAQAMVTGVVEFELALLSIDGDWGLFASGNTYVVTPSGLKNPPGPGEGAGIVVTPVGFELSGNAGSDVHISLVLPGSFISDDESGELVVSNWNYGWNYDNDPTATFNGTGQVTGNGISVTVGGGATSGLFLGATVTVPTATFPGSYTAQIIASAAYMGN